MAVRSAADFEVALGCRFRVAVPSASVGLPGGPPRHRPRRRRHGAAATARSDRRLPRKWSQPARRSRRQRPFARAGLMRVVEGDLEKGRSTLPARALDQPLPLPLCERACPCSGRNVLGNDHEGGCRPRQARGRAAARPRSCAQGRRGRFEAAMAFERQTFLELRGSSQAAALRHIFFAERAAPRPPELGGVEPRRIRSAAVIGGGTMGAGTRQPFVMRGCPSTLVERDECGTSNAAFPTCARFSTVWSSAVRSVPKPRPSGLSAVTGTTDYGLRQSRPRHRGGI